MKYSFILLWFITSSILADGIPESYFSTDNPRLNAQEKAGLEIARRWQANQGGLSPVAGQDGSVRFLYEAQQPSIVCAVLQVCDIELQQAEQVNSIHIGDQARWLIEPAITGSGSTETQHIIVKPMDVGLETTLIVTTDRRTYHLRLRSHRKEFMPRISFIYRDDLDAKWQALKARKEQEQIVKNIRTIPETGEYLNDLDFSYTVAGKASWKPLRVYNNGVKTIIQMPGTISQQEAPTLLIVRKDGDIFRDEETVMVNYRMQGDRYIVDSIFDKAILIAGVGNSQDRVTITRGNP